MEITRTQAIKAFLQQNTRTDLADLYSLDMECQVNVAQDGGERIEGEYEGRQWHGWTDGLQTWKSFRIPHNAAAEPTFDDRRMVFDLSQHAEGIGMTGWDWTNRVSRWVAYDFDDITGHSDKHAKKLSFDELSEIKQVATGIPWVTVRLSTSGKGLHLYVFFDDPIPTANHTEHAALARAILSKMASLTGCDFKSKVDTCGGNMWVWHRKMKGTEGLTVIKLGDKIKISEIPLNWHDHINVIRGTRKKATPVFIDSKSEEMFTELAGQRNAVKLDEDHKKLIRFLDQRGSAHWWDSDHHMLVAHTFDLAAAKDALGFKGIFKTLSTGSEHGNDHNCFLFPLRRGAWVVRRYTRGVAEDSSWDQDAGGYTRCYLNAEPDLASVARAYGGLKHPTRGFSFKTAKMAEDAARILGAELGVPEVINTRPVFMRKSRDGDLVIEMDRATHDNSEALPGWIEDKGNKWVKVIALPRSTPAESDIESFDDVVRHLVTPSDGDSGWSVKSDNLWRTEPLIHAKAALDYLGLKVPEVKAVIGGNVLKPWMLVNKPFQPEYPGDRRWNRDAAQFSVVPSFEKERLFHPTWSKLLNHIGENLTSAVLENQWCQVNGLKTGGDYLKCWIASVLQEPTSPLPYLFLYGDQKAGKSLFHEALMLLMTKGYARAERALQNQNGFNAELETSIICVVEEINLSRDKVAYNRIKDWVTSLLFPVHRKHVTPYLVTNTTHWIQCANDRAYVPVFPGDTRIVMIYVNAIPDADHIPKKDFLSDLEKEAPDFLAAVLRLEIPRSQDRLNMPVIETIDKINASEANESALSEFVRENCFYVPGAMISIAEFYDKFVRGLDPVERHEWGKKRVSVEVTSHKFPKGRNTKNSDWSYGNISFDSNTPASTKLITVKDKLVPETMYAKV